MWNALEPEDRNQKYASVQRQPTASVTSVITVIIIITTIIPLINLKVGNWALSFGAFLQEGSATMNFRQVSMGARVAP